MSARDVTFTLMALGHVAGCRGKTATEMLAEAAGEIVRLQTALERILAVEGLDADQLERICDIANEALNKEG